MILDLRLPICDWGHGGEPPRATLIAVCLRTTLDLMTMPMRTMGRSEPNFEGNNTCTRVIYLPEFPRADFSASSPIANRKSQI
jgi:hypothetical protein